MGKVISRGLPPQKVDPAIVAMIRRSRRSWWQARYADGKVLGEWETMTALPLLPLGDGRTSRWEEANKDGMVGLRLLCPNGMCAELEAPEGHHFIQLKKAHVSIDAGGSRQAVDAHIIGVIIDSQGECFCRAWEYQTQKLTGFYDNVLHMAYCNIGKLSLEVQGVKL